MQCVYINECVCANDRLYAILQQHCMHGGGLLTSDQVKKDLYEINVHIVME